MAMRYFLEYFKNDENPEDMGVYIHLHGNNPPVYLPRTTKEDYAAFPEESQSEWISGLLNVEGVVEVSSKAYRVWVDKSPAYTWEEVLTPLLGFMQEQFGESESEEIPGYGNMTLPKYESRRAP